MIIAVILYFALTAIAALFQIALALGAPWGEYAMGGRYPGKLPSNLRIAAVIQMAVLALLALIVFVRSGLGFDTFFPASRVAIWFVVAFFVLGTILNLVTPSKRERMIWAPVNIVLLVVSVFVALNG
jgi:hypothetical protein